MSGGKKGQKGRGKTLATNIAHLANHPHDHSHSTSTDTMYYTTLKQIVC